jgi:hypothetical protein
MMPSALQFAIQIGAVAEAGASEVAGLMRMMLARGGGAFFAGIERRANGRAGATWWRTKSFDGRQRRSNPLKSLVGDEGFEPSTR